MFRVDSDKYKQVVDAIILAPLPSLRPLVLIPNAACRYCEKPSSDVHTLQFLFIDQLVLVLRRMYKDLRTWKRSFAA